MHEPHEGTVWSRKLRPAALWAVASLLCAALAGCAALTNPVGDGVPVRHLSPQLLGKAKDGEETIPLSLLGQPQPDTYRLAAGDTLGVWVEGVVGDKAVPMPVYIAPPVQIPLQRRLPIGAGYPAPVREDGTVVLPLLEPVPVQGLSVAQAEDVIRAAYTKKQILPAGKERVVVTLLQARQYHVVVMRQESAGTTTVADAIAPIGKRGTGYVLDLPAYENDVLHALAQTGGMPGLDAFDEVIIQRALNGGPGPQAACPMPGPYLAQHAPGGQVTHIPLRRPRCAPVAFGPQDVVLHSGDVVFLESRDTDVFYTGGLLPPGQYILPRNYDLTVTEAISRVKGPLVNGAYGTNTLAGNLINPGIGNPSPSLLTVLRRTPGGQVAIRVNLNRALRNPRENITVQPGDMLVLQEQPSEALVRYFTQVFFNFSLAWQAVHDRFITGVVDVNAVQSLPGRIGITNVTGVPGLP